MSNKAPERILAWTVNDWGSAWSVAPEDAAPDAVEYIRADLVEAAVKRALEAAAEKADEHDYDLGPHSETTIAGVVAEAIRAMSTDDDLVRRLATPQKETERMNYDTKKMDVDLKWLDEAISGKPVLEAAFIFSQTPQGFHYWSEGRYTIDDLKEIRRQYLEQLDCPFGDLDPYVQRALKDSGGPWEIENRAIWYPLTHPDWWPDIKYRLAPRKDVAEEPTDGKTFSMLVPQCDVPKYCTEPKPKEKGEPTETPKLWRDMTDAEKGALLLAHHEERVIEWNSWDGGPFNMDSIRSKPVWDDDHAYRIKTEPVRKTVVLYGKCNVMCWGFSEDTDGSATHRITFALIDGKMPSGTFTNDKGETIVVEETE